MIVVKIFHPGVSRCAKTAGAGSSSASAGLGYHTVQCSGAVRRPTSLLSSHHGNISHLTSYSPTTSLTHITTAVEHNTRYTISDD